MYKKSSINYNVIDIMVTMVMQAKSPIYVYIMFCACIQTLVHPMRSKGIQFQGRVSVCVVHLLINKL